MVAIGGYDQKLSPEKIMSADAGTSFSLQPVCDECNLKICPISNADCVINDYSISTIGVECLACKCIDALDRDLITHEFLKVMFS